jgi:hypothetical protein
MIFQTNSTPGFYYYDGSKWVALSPKGVNKSLSNLTAPTAVNVNLLPGVTNSIDLGSPSLQWHDLYVGERIFMGGNPFLSASYGTGPGNVALGANAFVNNGTGATNTAIGNVALYNNNTGYSNVAVGASALKSSVSCHNTVAVGDSALFSQINDTYVSYTENTAIGSKAMFSNTGGYENAATGFDALFANTTGAYNTANGAHAVSANTTGSENTGIGSFAMNANTTGSGNTASGFSALSTNTTGDDNTATGNVALSSTTTGSYNTATGAGALSYNDVGSSNVAAGAYCLNRNTSGFSNVAIGVRALFGNTTGSLNSAFGDSADVSSINLSNATAIGARAFVSASNSLVLGSINGMNGATSNVNVGIGTSSPAKRLHVQVNGSSGATSLAGTGILLEDNSSTYLSILSPTSSQNGILFGNTSSNQKAAIVFNNSGNRSGLQLNAGGVSRMTLDSTGHVGIGNFNPSHRLELNTDDAAKPSTSTWTIASDAKLKTNISDFKEGLDVVKKIHPVWFEYNGKAQLPTGIRSVGIVAQEIQKIAPYMVGKYKYTDATSKTEEYLDYNANALFYLLVNSVKELSSKNDALVSTNDEQKSEIQNLISEVDALKQIVLQLQQNFNSCNPCAQTSAMSDELSMMSGASLSQNIPNPFNHTTTINYAIPQQYSSAKIIVTDKIGKALKQINLAGSGKGSVQVDASTLSSGAYQYSLVIDGKLIDTKQMEHIK